MGRRDRDRMAVGFTTMHTQSVPIASDLRQVGGFLRIPLFPPPKLAATI